MQLGWRQLGDVTAVDLDEDTLDAERAETFRVQLEARLHASRKVLLDLGAVAFADSTGLGAILVCLHRAAAALHFPWWASGLLIDGIYLGLAWVTAVMLPPMAIFFPLFTLLEAFGYLPRVAFNLDRMFNRVGAHGKQALSMMMGFGCNAAGVVATRIIDSPRERLIAIITNNFSICNGRWPLLILMGTGAVAIGFVLKGVALTTTYNPTFLGFSSLDMLLISLLCYGMAMVLTARTWLRINEPHLQALQRRLGEEEARRRAQEFEERNGFGAAASDGSPEPVARSAGSGGA